METPSRVATSAAGLGIAAFVPFAGVPIGIQLGVLGPESFRVFLLGVLLGVIALPVAAFALWWTRPAAHRDGRGRAALGGALALLVVGTALALGASGSGVPPINDITTDLEDPPSFVHAATLTGVDMSYDAATFADPTRSGYPDLGPTLLELPPPAAFERAERAATELGWEITHRDRATGTLEATQVSSVFRFVDDVVVRIRPANGGSRLDLRSRSRIGRSDLGANAARIRAFQEAVQR